MIFGTYNKCKTDIQRGWILMGKGLNWMIKVERHINSNLKSSMSDIMK